MAQRPVTFLAPAVAGNPVDPNTHLGFLEEVEATAMPARTAVGAFTILAAVTRIVVHGWAATGDAPPASYVRTTTTGAAPDRFSTNSGAVWWQLEFLGGDADPRHFGCVCDGVTDDTAAFLAALQACDGKARLVIDRTILLATWAGHPVQTALRIASANGGKFDFTGSAAGQVFTVAAAAAVIDIEGLEWTGPAGLDLFDLIALTGTMTKFRFAGNRVAGFGKMFWSNNLGTIEELFITGNHIDGAENGFKIDLLLGHVEISFNTLSNIVNAADELMYGFRIGKDAAAGWTNQTASAFFHIHHNKIDRIESTSVATQASNGVNAIAVYGEDILVESNTIHDVISTKTTDVEGIYTKARRSVVRGNILKNAGTDQGAITVKGEHPASGAQTNPVGDWNVIEDNHIDGAGFGVYFSVPNTTVRNNMVRNTTKRAIWGQHNTVGLGRVVVTGNRIVDCVDGILVEGPTDGLTIAANVIEAQSKATGDAVGVFVDLSSAAAASGLINIRGNVIDGVAAASGDASGVVLVTGAQNAARLDIDGNTFNGLAGSAKSQPILISGAMPAPTSVNVARNRADKWYGEINTGKALFSTFTFDDNRCVWSEAANAWRDLVTFYMVDGRTMRARARVLAHDDSAPIKHARYDLEAERKKDDGLLTTPAAWTDVDAQEETGAPTWGARISTVVDDTATDLVVTGTDIGFTATQTIGATTTDLSIFEVGEKIKVTGSASNNATLTIATVSATTITTVETSVVTEAAGASVTLTKVHEALSLQVKSNDAVPVIDWRARVSVDA